MTKKKQRTANNGDKTQQTFIDTYSKIAFAKVYDRKNALTVGGSA